MGIAWTVITCPVYGKLQNELVHLIENKPEPWRSHALGCLQTEKFTSLRTMLILGLDDEAHVRASAWLSVPDMILLRDFKAWTYLYHVYVQPEFRLQGLGEKTIQQVIAETEKYDVTGILLSAGDEKVRQSFYGHLGFVDVPPDPWLMTKHKERSLHGKSRKYAQSSTILRQVSLHDLATAQSICAHRHWICTPKESSEVGPQECEEDFCGLFTDDKASSFFVRIPYQNGIVLSWVVNSVHGWIQRLLCPDIKNNDLVEKIASKIGDITEKVTAMTHDQLRVLNLKPLLEF